MPITCYLLDALKYSALILLYGVVPWLLLALVMQFISVSLRRSLANIFGVSLYILLTAPGVAVHELGHALFCIIFRHKIEDMKLFSPEEDGTLGYVSHTYNTKSIYQRIGNFFIGTGPVWLGLTALWFTSAWLLPQEMTCSYDSISGFLSSFSSEFFSFGFWARWQSWLWLYLSFAVTSHITLSAPDLLGAADGIIAIINLVLAACFCFGWLGEWENTAVIPKLQELIFAASGTVGIIVIISGAFALILRLVPRK